MSHLDRPGLVAALVAALTWAPAGLFVRLLPELSLTGIVGGRMGFAALLLGAAAWPRRVALARTLRQPLAWALAALMVAYYVLAVADLRLAPVGEATLCINTVPLFALAWRLVRRQPVHRRERLGAGVAFVGVAVLLLPSLLRGEAGALRALGDALGLGAAATGAAYALAYRHTTTRGRALDPFAVTLLTFVLGALVLLPGTPWPGMEARTLDVLGAFALVTTALPTLAYSLAAQRLPSVVATTVRLLTPVAAAFLAAVFLGERPDLFAYAGAALVLGGLLLLVRPPKPALHP